MKTINPFLVKGYLGDEYFCDRVSETSQIISAIENGRNLNLYNIRRIGKTALIHHSLAQLSDQFIPVFIDIEKTESQQQLVGSIVDVLVKKIDELDKGLLRKIIQWATSLGLTITLDESTGIPKAEIHMEERLSDKSLEEAFSLTKLIKNKRFVIAIDEFQQIVNYPENNTEAIFRSIAQSYPEITFLFSGSSRHLMERIFSDVSSPFYQSTENIQLGYIPLSEYLDFAKKFLPDCDEEMLRELITWCRQHTYYVQYTLNVLYETISYEEKPTIRDIKERILKSHEFYYYSVRKLVSKDQWNILKVIASNSPVSKPLSADFSSKTGLAQSTLKYNIKQLEEKDLLLREADGLKIYNVFFGHLLAITKS